MEGSMSLGILVALVIVFGGSIAGVLMTKKPGWGRYTVSALLLILVLFSAVLTVLVNALELQVLANVLFAVAGYAGGLITAKDNTGNPA